MRYPRDERRSLGDLKNMRIRTPDAGQVPFSQIAVVEPGRGFASIRRVDRNRAVNITASIDPGVTSADAVIADLNARILERARGVAVSARTCDERLAPGRPLACRIVRLSSQRRSARITPSNPTVTVRV